MINKVTQARVVVRGARLAAIIYFLELIAYLWEFNHEVLNVGLIVILLEERGGGEGQFFKIKVLYWFLCPVSLNPGSLLIQNLIIEEYAPPTQFC